MSFGITKIFLVRHGQTTGDVEDRYGGDYDDHLTDLGKKQASELAEKLRNKGIELIFTSPKIRALETTEVLSKTLGVETKVIENFREKNNWGVLTGMVKAEARKKYPHLVELLKDTRNTIEGAEDYSSFGRRIRLALGEVRNSGFQAVAVVTHGGPIRFIFREILALGEIKIADCAWTLLKVENGQFNLEDQEGIQFVE